MLPSRVAVEWAMGQLFASVASLRFFGDDLIPERISEALGARPTSASRKGDLVTVARGGREVRAPTGSWRLKTDRLRPGDLDRHVRDIFSGLTQDTEVWLSLSRRFRADVFFGLFIEGCNEGVSLSPESLRAGGLRGVLFDFDLYAPDVHAAR